MQSQKPILSLPRAIWAVAEKDFRSEWRSRAAFNAVALFSLAAPVALGYALANLKLNAEVLGGLLWMVLFFASMIGLPRAFVKEEESGTATLLRLHYRSDAVLWGKAISQLALLVSTQIAAIPLFLMLLNARVMQPAPLLAALILGDVGLSVASCILGAMASQAKSRGALFPALAAPLMLPLLASLSVASGTAFGAGGDAWPPLKMVFAFDVALLAASWLLFEFVWE
ncbi:heme exporter protein CcmB [Abditibacterium utsteinense]|uniref:heme exporter protein CcmB n=1 Tax=Abditibacterium utsteinense TaxID=1960156 RepID=UPI00130046BC|nr:heme exporter protein CcmB [Abditibacterium utsteinense]